MEVAPLRYDASQVTSMGYNNLDNRGLNHNYVHMLALEIHTQSVVLLNRHVL